MSVESERQRLWKIFNDDNCYPDEMMEAVDLDHIVLEAQAEMPCYRLSGLVLTGIKGTPYIPDTCLTPQPYDVSEVILCPACKAAAALRAPV